MEYTDLSCSHRGCFVYYELYIDQFFGEHFLVGYLLLRLGVLLDGSPVARRRIAAASLLQAALAAGFLAAGIRGGSLAGFLAAGSVVFGKRLFWRGTAVLLFASVCFGGTLIALLQIIGLPKAILVAAAAEVLWYTFTKFRRREAGIEERVPVRLEWDGRTECMYGMIDTGNHLSEPLSGCPVSIVEASAVRALLGDAWEERRGFYLVPYHSIGTQKGWLRAAAFDRMYVRRGQDWMEVERPVLALYEGQVSAGETYRLILHPMHAAYGKKIQVENYKKKERIQ